MDSSRLFPSFVVLALLFAVAIPTANAGSMGNGAAQRQKLVVDSVDVSTGTIVLKSGIDNSIHTYKFDASTRVGLANSKGTIDQIKAGMKVYNYTVKGGQTTVDGQTLSFIGVSPAAPTNAPPGAAQ